MSKEYDPSQEPWAKLELDEGREILMTPHNGSLFTFIGRTMLSDGTMIESSNIDHVFVAYDRQDGHTFGTYIFSHNPAFQQLRDYMVENAFPAHLNMRQVAECDVQAYEGAIAQEFQNLDTFPEDWK